MVDVPTIRYVRNGDVALAYQVLGDGPIDLVFLPSFLNNLEIAWESPLYARFLRRLASFSRLILMDRRGTGLSDRMSPGDLPPLEVMMDDLVVVLDAVGVKARGGVRCIGLGMRVRTVCRDVSGAGRGARAPRGCRSGYRDRRLPVAVDRDTVGRGSPTVLGRVGDAGARRTEAREVHPIARRGRAPPGLVRALDAAVREPERGRCDPSSVVADRHPPDPPVHRRSDLGHASHRRCERGHTGGAGLRWANPGCPLPGAPRGRQLGVERGPGDRARRDRTVRDRPATGRRDRPRARDGLVHRHRGLDAASRRPG